MPHQVIVDASAPLEVLGAVLADALVVSDHFELAAALGRAEAPILLSDESVQAVLDIVVKVITLATTLALGNMIVNAAEEVARHAIEEHYTISAEMSLDLKRWHLGKLDGKVVLTPPPK